MPQKPGDSCIALGEQWSDVGAFTAQKLLHDVALSKWYDYSNHLSDLQGLLFSIGSLQSF